jgi:hypothetical protein
MRFENSTSVRKKPGTRCAIVSPVAKTNQLLALWVTQGSDGALFKASICTLNWMREVRVRHSLVITGWAARYGDGSGVG